MAKGCWGWLGALVVLSSVSVLVLGGFSLLARRPNVLLITLDTVRPDHVGFYGYRDRETSPHLDQWAKRARVYDAATTSTPYTAPTHLSFLTGLRALEHGLLTNGRLAPAKLPRVAETFQSRGYDTAGFVSSYVLNRRFGFATGFRTFDDGLAPSRKGDNPWWKERFGVLQIDRNGEETVQKAIEWLASPRSTPWFLWVHLFDAHEPYSPPPGFSGRFARSSEKPSAATASYDEEILYLDHLVQTLLDAAARTGRPRYTILLSDHGEGLGEHGEPHHGDKLYDQTIRLLFAISGPGVAPGRDPSSVGAAAVGRGLLALARGGDGGDFRVALPYHGSDPESGAQILIGRRRLKSGQSWDATIHPLFTVTSGDLGIVHGRWRLLVRSESNEQGRLRIVPGMSELYDVASDPQEQRNLAAAMPDETLRLERQLSVILSRNQSQFLLQQTPPDAEAVKSLRALGYLQ